MHDNVLTGDIWGKLTNVDRGTTPKVFNSRPEDENEINPGIA